MPCDVQQVVTGKAVLASEVTRLGALHLTVSAIGVLSTANTEEAMGRSMLKRAAFVISVFAAALPAVAQAQLRSETTDGNFRICRYAPATNVLSVGTPRTLRIGIGENCPFTPPRAETPSLPVPPTAQLRADSVSEQRRTCLYEQAGRRWAVELVASAPCPLYAGIVAGGGARTAAN